MAFRRQRHTRADARDREDPGASSRSARCRVAGARAPGGKEAMTRKRCLTENEISEAVEGMARPEVTEHLAKCRRCRNTLEFVAELIHLFDDSAEEAKAALARVKTMGEHRAKAIEGGAPAHQWEFAATR